MSWYKKSFVSPAITQKNKGLYTISQFFFAAYLEKKYDLMLYESCLHEKRRNISWKKCKKRNNWAHYDQT